MKLEAFKTDSWQRRYHTRASNPRRRKTVVVSQSLENSTPCRPHHRLSQTDQNGPRTRRDYPALRRLAL